MQPTIQRSRLPALLAVLLGCTGGPWEIPQYDPAGQSDPEDYEECHAAGGIEEPSFLGDRCILILPQPRGEDPYESCLYRGGVPVDVNFTNRPTAPTADYR